MARTIRRKNVKYHYDWVLTETVRTSGMYGYRVRVDQHSKAGKKLLAEYHSDSGFGDYSHMSPPHWYRRYRNKVATSKEKQHIIKYLKDPEYEVPKPVRVGDASWYW